MKVHTTNYQNTFIEVAEDSPATRGEVPPVKGEKTMANIQFDMMYDHPYQYTSDDVVFHCYAVKNKLGKSELEKARAAFFSKGQPCLRCSPLTKRYGFGVHSDAQGRVALYPLESKEYKQFAKNKSLKVVKAMRSKKA